MDPRPPANESFAAMVARLGLASDAGPMETVARPAVSDGSPSFGSLPSLDSASDRSAELIASDSLTTTSAGADPTLDRPVALKRVRAEEGPRAAAALVAEARILAALEHPGIPPVHALARDARGLPVVVYKHLQGRTWAEVARPPEPRRDLAIALRVADALAFTHAHGYLHRDVRPDHVIVGDYGEVCLEGWGCACPLAQGVTTEVVGTPGYIAPEMVRPGARLSPSTDVYLLGLSLLHICTSVPPRSQASAEEALAAAWEAAPVPVVGLPEALAAVIRRAVAPAPEDRHPTMAAFAAELRGVLEHLGASGLAAEATAAVDRLEAALAAGDVAASNHFAEARFGFEAALAAWPACPEAHRGLARALSLHLPDRLRVGDLAAVASLLPLLAEDERPRWEQALAAARARQAQMEAEWWSGNLRFGARERRNFGVAIAVAASVLPFGVAAGMPDGPVTVEALVVLAALTIGILAAITWPYRRDLLRHGASRAIVLGLAWSSSVSLVGRVLAWHAGTPAPTVLRSELLVQAACVLVVALFGDGALAVGALPLVFGALLVHARPDLAGDLYPTSVAVCLLLWLGVFWARDRANAAQRRRADDLG